MNIKVIAAILITIVLAITLPVTFRLAQKQQIFQPKAEGACTNNPSNTNAPANYSWVASCNTTCATNNDCPKNTGDSSNVDSSTSAWCYGFDSPGPRCLQLQYTGIRTPVADDCKDNPSGTNAPSGYSWKADCSKFCKQNSECPQNTSDPSNVNPTTSNWCYGFNAAPRCLQLKHLGGGLSSGGGTGGTGADRCPVTPSCCSTPLAKCTSGPKNTTECKTAGYQWCYNGYCINDNYDGEGTRGSCTGSTAPAAPAGGGGTGGSGGGTGAACSVGKTCTCSGLSAGACDQCNGGWCKDGKCETCSAITPAAPAGGGTGGSGGSSTGGSAGGVEASSCSFKILEPSTLQPPGRIESQKSYRLEISMTNSAPSGSGSIWKQGSYKLVANAQTQTTWGAKPAYDLSESQNQGQDVTPGESVMFYIDMKAPQIGSNPEPKAFNFMMSKEGKNFGSACEPQNLTVFPPSTPPEVVEPVTTSCYAISENVSDVESVRRCDSDNPIIHPFTDNPLNFRLSNTPGEKNIYVMFLDNKNNRSNNGRAYVKKVILSPDPVITSVVCHQTGTIEISGRNLGAQGVNGKAKVRAGSQDATITSWTASKIAAQTTKKLEGVTSITLITDEDKTLNSSCSVDTTILDFTAGGQCKVGGISMSDVDVKIFHDDVSQSPTQPFLRQSISLDRNGKPSGLNSKLEAGKNYVLILKGKDTLARRKNFTAFSGTTVIPDKIVLPVGDIAPRDNPDGKINAIDTSELKSQWSLVKDVVKSGDLNGDGRINSLDYSCILQNINKEDDVFTVSSNTGVGATNPNSGINRNFNVKGKVFMDSNADGLQNNSETTIPGITVLALRPNISPEVPGQTITAVQAAAAITLGQTVTDGNGEYSMRLTPPMNILNLVIWVNPGSKTGIGGQKAIGIGAFTDSFFVNNPLNLDIPVLP